MGYYTHYSLEMEGEESPINRILDLFDDPPNDVGIKGFSYGGIYYHLGDIYHGYAEFCKWYNFEEEMKKFSKMHPEVIFILDGDGEERRDVWRMYFKNGKSSKRLVPKLTFPDFDTSNWS